MNNRYIRNKGYYICLGWFNSYFKIDNKTTDYLRKFAVYFIKTTFDTRINGYVNIKIYTLSRQLIKLKITSRAFRRFFKEIQKNDIEKWILIDRYKFIEKSKNKAILRLEEKQKNK